MGRSCRGMQEVRSAYRFLIGISEGMRLLDKCKPS